MNYKELFYLGTFNNWFDLWCLFLGAFVLIGGLVYFRDFLEWVIYFIFNK